LSIQPERNYGMLITIGLAVIGAIVVGALMLIRGDEESGNADGGGGAAAGETR
jgi:hypothetical protein